MKNFVNKPFFKVAAFCFLFLLTSITLFYDYTLITSFVSPSYKGVYYFLPTFVILIVPSIALVLYYNYIHHFNVRSKCKILLQYSLIVGIISFLCLGGSITCAIVGKFKPTSIENAFPYGTIVFSALFLISAILVAIYLQVNKVGFKIEKTSTIKVKKYKSIIGLILLLFAAFFFGDFLNVFTLIGKPYDQNFPLMVPIFLTFLYGTVEVILYVIYKSIKDFDRRFMFYKNSLFVFTIVYLVLNTFVVASIMVNLNIFEQSMVEFFPTERLIGFPIGFLATVIIPLGPIVYSCIRFGLVKNEQKRKENFDKI